MLLRGGRAFVGEYELMWENKMFKSFWVAVTLLTGTLVALSQATDANAAAAAPLHVLQLEKYFNADPLVQNVHGWHCRRRAGPYGWHRHRRACRRDYDPYEEPYYDDGHAYDDGRYYDGGPSIVIRPNRRARRGCSRKEYRHCIRRWRAGSRRRARCLRKYRC